jgi:hypothetical protein
MSSKLPYVIECKSTLPFFEVIAGFNCEPPARRYAQACAKGGPQNEYRVVKNRKVLVTFKGEFQYSDVE